MDILKLLPQHNTMSEKIIVDICGFYLQKQRKALIYNTLIECETKTQSTNVVL